MEDLRYKKLEKILRAGELPDVAHSIAFDLYEEGVTSKEWHSKLLTDSTGHKINPLLSFIPDPLLNNIYLHLRDLEMGLITPSRYRIRLKDDNFLF